MKVILIRHAETVWNRAGMIQGRLDSPLTPRGEEECDALIAALGAEGLSPAYVISSSAGRTQRLAERISAHFHCAREIDDALREQHFGEFDGRLLSDIHRSHPRFAGDTHFQPPGGESLAQAAQRLIPFLHHLPERYPNTTVALVSHGQIIQATIALLVENRLDNITRYHHPNASYSLLAINPDACEVVRWGIASHLLRLRER